MFLTTIDMFWLCQLTWFNIWLFRCFLRCHLIYHLMTYYITQTQNLYLTILEALVNNFDQKTKWSGYSILIALNLLIMCLCPINPPFWNEVVKLVIYFCSCESNQLCSLLVQRNAFCFKKYNIFESEFCATVEIRLHYHQTFLQRLHCRW